MKLGIIGDGQLGRMLLQAASNYNVESYVLSPNFPDAPANTLANHAIKGSINEEEDVFNFGQALDAVTIEIEHVNTTALEKLQKHGVQVIPKVEAISIIKNKILQKEFYTKNNIPTVPYTITKNLKEAKQKLKLPFVHKLAEGGYDGKGVAVIKDEKDWAKAFDQPAIAEQLVDIEKEIAVIVAADMFGNVTHYPCVEMIFNPELNLLDYQICPANLNIKQENLAISLAKQVVKALKSPGLFAVELILDKQGDFYVNETAPRVHNSGHHTIEANFTSQFDMLIRIVQGFTTQNADSRCPSAIINLIGKNNHQTAEEQFHFKDILKIQGVYLHWYGKKEIKAGRKVGHLTILGNTLEAVTNKVNRLKTILQR